jgi:hypothetical protein
MRIVDGDEIGPDIKPMLDPANGSGKRTAAVGKADA